LFNFQLDYDPIEIYFKVILNANSINALSSKYGDTINNSWLYMAMAIGNLQTIKLYINGELVGTAVNTSLSKQEQYINTSITETLPKEI
jgi:hypothetical protein